MRKSLLYIIIAVLLLTGTAYSIELRETGYVDAGIRPFFGVSFGEFYNQYNNPSGFLIYGRGYYALDINQEINLFPEAGLGWFYMSHESESGTHLSFFPLYLNCIMDWKNFHINYKWGVLTFLPYAGLGINYITYKSPRMEVSQFDFGYQIGAHLIYNHIRLKNFYIELGLVHCLAAEINAAIGLMKISLGAGYQFELAEKSGKEDFNKNKALYIQDLNSDDEEKIIKAAIWLGRNEADEAITRLVDLLLKDRSASVRRASAVSLGLMREKDTLEPLTYSATRDGDPEVRYTSLLSIFRIGPDKKSWDAVKEIKQREKDPLILNYIEQMGKYSALLSISRITPTEKNMETIRQMKNTEQDAQILDYIKNMEELFK